VTAFEFIVVGLLLVIAYPGRRTDLLVFGMFVLWQLSRLI
jgi:hypothetical protein